MTDLPGLDQATTLPTVTYHDPEWFAREREAIFARISDHGPLLSESLGALMERGADQPIESLTYSQRLTQTIEANDCFVADPDAHTANEEIVRLGVEVLDEDRRICELVQRNLEAGVYIEGRLSPRHENGVHAFQTWVRAAIAQASFSTGSRSNASELTQ